MDAGRELRLFAVAVTFLTRLPVPGGQGEGPEDGLARAARYFPLVGVLVGAVAGLVWIAALSVTVPAVAAGLAIAAGMLVTGALHEDGLADTIDGLGGGATRERALEIMRDSRIGVFGAAGLVISVGLRWASLAQFDAWTGLAALVCAHAIGRTLVVAAISSTEYAREEGTGTTVADGARSGELALAVALALLIALVGCGWSGLHAAVAGAAAGAVMIMLLVRRLGGYTGDGLGAVEQVSETAALVVLAGALADG